MSKQPRQKLSSILKNNLFMLKKVARYTPDYFFWMIVEGVVWGTINSASGVFSFHLLNTVEEGTDFPAAAGMIGLMALFYIVVYAFDRWYWQIQNPLMRQKLHLKMHEELFVKARSLDLSCFDDPEFYNDFVWAMDQSDKRAVEVLEDTGKLINRIVASTTLVGLLLTVDPVISVILFPHPRLPLSVIWWGTKSVFATARRPIRSGERRIISTASIIWPIMPRSCASAARTSC